MITFRFAKTEDLENIVSTYNATIPGRMVTADLEPVSVESKTNWFNSHSEDKRPVWVVSFENHYAGWMSFSSFYGRPAYDGTVEVSIYLEEKFKNKGIGKACLQMALEVAPILKVQNLLGFIFGHNAVSLHLFKSFGFVTWGHLPGVALMDGLPRDLIIVGKKIN